MRRIIVVQTAAFGQLSVGHLYEANVTCARCMPYINTDPRRKAGNMVPIIDYCAG